MNIFFIKAAEFFGVFTKLRGLLKGKKTMISAVAGMLASAGTVVGMLIPWIQGDIDMSQFLKQVEMPALAFWASATFLFSSFHTKNILEEKGER